MKASLDQKWDLDGIFKGGSGSESFAGLLRQLGEDIGRLRSGLNDLEHDDGRQSDQSAELVRVIGLMQDISGTIREAQAFTECLAAQDQTDKAAVRLGGAVATLHADFSSTVTLLDKRLSQLEHDRWETFIGSDKLRAIAFLLAERRELAREKLPAEQEALVYDLAVDGYHAWGEAYNTAVSHWGIDYEADGKTERLSAGQAHNKLQHPDRKVRREVFGKWERAWADNVDYYADALNHIGGFRLQLYKHRKWSSVHKEPLFMNRMSERTLEAMWETIERNKPVFVEYLSRKAQLLGIAGLSWHDVEAPLGSNVKHYSYEEGARFIVEQFRKISPKMAEFAAAAFEQRWIEAEDRPGKRPGGFCTSFPVSGQTRIFMTYAGTASNVSTLAHELGHAYHQHVMNDLPYLAQDYAMNVAETASTFAELIVSDAAMQAAATDEERLALLDDKIQRSVAFFMNIHARFLFETDFYKERTSGIVSAERLCELMEDAQKKAYHGALHEWDPYFWASKLHFYLTDVPFYNFPYTFGYLFSAGIYERALQQGSSFEDRYVALLRDTGSMTVEQLARKHLDADLTKPDFWQQAIEPAVRDVKLFMNLTANR